MRKHPIAILILALLLLFTGCDQTPTSTPETQPPTTSCQHVWKDATCTAPKTCTVCAATEGDAAAHSWVPATCTAPKTCSVCAATEGDVAAHPFTAGYCSACGAPDKNSDEYKYDFLKKKADAISFSCARTALRDMLKNPSTMNVLSEEVLDSDKYFRYYIKIEYTAQNGFGGTVTNTAYFLIRINPEMNTNFYSRYSASGVNYPVTDSEKSAWGWGSEPEDWSLDAANNYINPTEVSLKLLLANPGTYKGKYVKITEQLVLYSNSLSRKSFKTYQSGNSQNSIEVFYRMCDNADDCILLDADFQKITVIGEVKVFSDSPSPYIEAYEIIFE
ncbi:MAG: hypothetical protein IKJ35_05335 [Clostridia bacterium]|nr:hypothetical protein [Clostridia bacterium]